MKRTLAMLLALLILLGLTACKEKERDNNWLDTAHGNTSTENNVDDGNANPTGGTVVAPVTLPTGGPTITPTVTPTTEPATAPTDCATIAPTVEPIQKPTSAPTVKPTTEPTVKPTSVPTLKPTSVPTVKPTEKPTVAPTTKPTTAPTAAPTTAPTAAPTTAPTTKPTEAPTAAPTTPSTTAPTNAGTYYTYSDSYGNSVQLPEGVDVFDYTLSQANLPQTVSKYPAIEQKIYQLTNAERAKYGLAPLALEEKAYFFVSTRAYEASILWDHTRPNGEPYYHILAEYKVIGSSGENLYYIGGGSLSGDYVSSPANADFLAENAITGWMNSPGHRANMLSGDWKSMAVGVYYDAQANELFSVQLFFA